MNASTTFDTAKAIASAIAKADPATLAGDTALLAESFPSERKADVCRLLAEALKEKANRNGLSASATLSKALNDAKGFTPLELASLKAFWQLAVVADTAVNAK
jgi:hypothetical protein